MKIQTTPKWIVHVGLLCLLMITYGYLYAPALKVGFVGDDYYFLISGNTWNKAWKSLSNDWIRQEIDFTGARFYRPLQMILFYLEYRFLWGENPWGYHLDNLLIGMAGSLLIVPFVVLLAGEKYCSSPSVWWVGWAAAFLFALHPRHAEAICWISGRTDSLCGWFYLVSLLGYWMWRKGGAPTWKWFSCFAFALALTAKEMAITLPFVLLFYEIAVGLEQQSGNSRIAFASLCKRLYLHFLVLLLLFGVIRTWALGGYLYGKESYIQLNPSLNLYFSSLCKIFVASLLPFPSISKDIALIYLPHPIRYGLLLLLGIGILIYFLWKSKNWGGILGLLLWFGGSLPTLSQMSEPYTSLSDRYLYIPSIGWVLFISAILFRILEKPRMLCWAAGIILLVWLTAAGWQIHRYVLEWRKAGKTAEILVNQLYTLDRERPANEKFILLSYPSLYQGKQILNTGFTHYWFQKNLNERQFPRKVMPLLYLSCVAPPGTVTSLVRWNGNRLYHEINGGSFISAYYSAYGPVSLIASSFHPRSNQAEFDINIPSESTSIWIFDRGKFQRISADIKDIFITEKEDNQFKLKQYKMPEFHRIGNYQIVSKEFQARMESNPLRGLHLSAGKLDGKPTALISFGPSREAQADYPGAIFVWSFTPSGIERYPFSPFPRENPGAIRNPFGEVYTAAGNFIPNATSSQIACSQGLDGNGIVRLFQYNGQPAPLGYKVVGQFPALDSLPQIQPIRRGVFLNSGDLNRDGIDELLTTYLEPESGKTYLQILRFKARTHQELAPILYRSSGFPILENVGKILNLSIAVEDLDGDGTPEILASAQVISNGAEDDSVSIYLGIYKVQYEKDEIQFIYPIPNSIRQIKFPEPIPIRRFSVTCGNIDLDPPAEIIMVYRNTTNTVKLEGLDVKMNTDGSLDQYQVFFQKEITLPDSGEKEDEKFLNAALIPPVR